MTQLTQQILEDHMLMADPLKAKWMEEYMRGKFAFLGVQAPYRKEWFKGFWAENKNEIIQDYPALLNDLWHSDFREMQMVGLDILIKIQRKLTEEDITLLEDLITTKSWWDTVDMIASNSVAALLKKFDSLYEKYPIKWIQNKNIWLQRTAIIFQLKYKDEVNEDLLYDFILQTKDSKEFFIEKAAGWALRQYSKFNKQSVQNFIRSHPDLANLTVREGSKYLKR